jgi:RND family efflux transporter MFP subunit
LCYFAIASAQPVVETVAVQSQKLERTLKLTGEILPYQRVTLHARVSGFVESVAVDRGSLVKQGDVLVRLSAPEMAATIAEAEAKVQAAVASGAESAARIAAAQATVERLKKAAETPGAIAANEIIQAEKTLEAERAVQRSAAAQVRAAEAALQSARQLEHYLKVTAPFDGVITERFVHPGALAGPGSGPAGALLELEQIARLRLVAAVPEAEASSIRIGLKASFRVPAFGARQFSGTVARVDRSADPRTRTFNVELDVANPRAELAPGMFPEVLWPAHSSELLVPPTAVVTTTERTFVIRIDNGRARWVNVRKGRSVGTLVEVSGDIKAGDRLAARANDELRDGTAVTPKAP